MQNNKMSALLAVGLDLACLDRKGQLFLDSVHCLALKDAMLDHGVDDFAHPLSDDGWWLVKGRVFECSGNPPPACPRCVYLEAGVSMGGMILVQCRTWLGPSSLRFNNMPWVKELPLYRWGGLFVPVLPSIWLSGGPHYVDHEGL